MIRINIDSAELAKVVETLLEKSSYQKLASGMGVSSGTLWRLVEGRMVSLETALKIEAFVGGELLTHVEILKDGKQYAR